MKTRYSCRTILRCHNAHKSSDHSENELKFFTVDNAVIIRIHILYQGYSVAFKKSLLYKLMVNRKVKVEGATSSVCESVKTRAVKFSYVLTLFIFILQCKVG